VATSTMVNKNQGTHTLDELAILLITSPKHIEEPREGETVIIATKHSYFWAVLFSELVSQGKDSPEWFMERFRAVLADERDLLRLLYGSLEADPAKDVAYVVFREVARACDIDPEPLFERANAAYQSLLDKGLIEDPFKKKLATFVLAVVGLVPTGMSSTTEKGGAYVKEIHAPAWSYINEKDPNGKETKKVEIRLLKIIKVFPPKILEAYDEIVMSDGGNETTAKK
jgi:hypothetical protein